MKNIGPPECHSRRAKRDREARTATNILEAALDSRSGLRPAGNDTLEMLNRGSILNDISPGTPNSIQKQAGLKEKP